MRAAPALPADCATGPGCSRMIGMPRRPRLDPAVWTPPPAPARSRATAGSRPLPPLRRYELPGTGPEDVLVAPDGAVLTGLSDGRILRVTPDGNQLDTVADTGGRPLGLEWLPDGTLLVCDARRGLLRVAGAAVEVLTEGYTFCNNAAVGTDGTVYFTDSSTRFGIDHWRAELIEHSSTGRLLRRDVTGKVDVLLDGLSFANGVALTPDESSVLVAETGAYRVTRLWLNGPRAGNHEPFADNLPGFPDNISTGTDGTIWITQASPRDPVLDRLLPRPPALRRLAWSLPDRLQPQPRRTVWVLGYTPDGTLAYDLQGPGTHFHMVTGVREHDGHLWLGSLVDTAIARVGPLS
jgi:sugar lactone lactonase YvrE